MTPHMHIGTCSCLWPHLPSHLDLCHSPAVTCLSPHLSVLLSGISVWALFLFHHLNYSRQSLDLAPAAVPVCCAQIQHICCGEPPWLHPHPLAASWHANSVSVLDGVVSMLGKLLHLPRSNLSRAVTETKGKLLGAPKLQLLGMEWQVNTIECQAKTKRLELLSWKLCIFSYHTRALHFSFNSSAVSILAFCNTSFSSEKKYNMK